MRTTSPIVTYDDYLTLPADGKRYEIIEGELSMTPAPFTDHQRILGRLFRFIDEFARKNNAGEVFVAPTDVVQPDILFVTKERSHIITIKNIIAAPDLVIEILSESTAVIDRTTKKSLYEKYGVKEYWIVDPDNEVIECFLLKEAKFTLVGSFKKDVSFESVLLKGLTIEVNKIFN